MLQAAVGVETDGSVGPVTRAAVAVAEANPRELLRKLRATRERYEDEIVGRREVFWQGLVNRWNKALRVAESFLDGNAQPASATLPAGQFATAAPLANQARAEAMVGSATIVADRAARFAPDLQAAKAEMLKRFVLPNMGGGMRSFAAAEQSPDLNVVGVGIGEKVHEGAPTGVMAVKLFVQKKFPMASVPEAHALPTSIEGVPIDIEEVGRIVPLLGMPNPRQRFDIVPGGCSVGYDAQMAGTLGVLVRDRRGERCILSNSHVLAKEGLLPPDRPSSSRAFSTSAMKPGARLPR